jgi:hypothetical protein
MADDDQNKDRDKDDARGDEQHDGFDPWADLESDASSDLTEGFAFSFDENAVEARLDDALTTPPEDLRVVDPSAAAGMDDELEGMTEDALEDMVNEEGVGDFLSSAESSADDDDLVNAWLEDPASEPATGEQQLAVFSPDDSEDALGEADDRAAVDRSSIEIGTGDSGITVSSGIDEPGIDVLGLMSGTSDVSASLGEPSDAAWEPEQEGEPDRAWEPDEEAAGSPAIRNESPTEGADVIDFEMAAAAAAASGAGGEAVSGDAASSGRPLVKVATKAARKRGLGQWVGVVLGGVLAIPITLGILIWGLKQDPLQITKHLPESLAFLLPAEFQKGPATRVVGGPDLSAAASLEDLPAVEVAITDAGSEQPLASEETATEEPAVSEPAATAQAVEDVAGDRVVDEPMTGADEAVTGVEPAAHEAAAKLAAAAVDPDDVASVPVPQPSLDDLEGLMPEAEPAMPVVEPVPQVPPVVAVMPQPEPLDLSGVENAVADAMASLDAVNAAADPAGRGRTMALVEWYKQIARVAEEWAMLEHVAADSGRPLAEAPAAVAELYADIAARPELLDDLARLSRNWLAYAKRGGDGVVVPATFAETRQVGPYWYSRVSLVEAGGRTRELVVISRSEPAALAGDLILLTGLAMDGNVIWAADIRSAIPTERRDGVETGADSPVRPAEPDPFGLPDL